ncbi:prenyltransferase/squalene oxidase repeat-containing protein [Streptomyces sp. NPDC050610]|uniref:prenyltransferase/squalene oxidase repeat-containing protein n=1 Tax=Streptomyces sp. NPDC050610 TaxID=3157097 RepID=UPI00341FA9E9
MAPSPAVHARRGAAALAAAALLSAAAAPAAFADSPPPAAPGLYGTTNPQFDGVFRQSLAFLAQDSAGVTPAKPAVDWLAGQQCADGGFAGYRADTGTACDAKKGEFTDATAAAVQGLATVGGRGAEVKKGLDWLKATQNEDGGWGAQPGNPSNASSTATAIGAYAAAGQDPAKAAAKGGKSPYDALLTFQLGCDAKEGERGAFAYLPQKGQLLANDLASAAATLAASGKGYLVEHPSGGDKAPKPLACTDGNGKGKAENASAAADAGSAYLAAKLAGNGQHLASAMDPKSDKPDFGATADAVTALAAGGHTDAAGKAMGWLRDDKNGAAAWAKGDPGKLAKLILAAKASGTDPRTVGGDLVQQLNATGPKPEAADSSKKDAKDEKKKDDSGFGVWWFVGVCLVAGIGVGFLISGRKKNPKR